MAERGWRKGISTRPSMRINEMKTYEIRLCDACNGEPHVMCKFCRESPGLRLGYLHGMVEMSQIMYAM